MTPKEKANDLIREYLFWTINDLSDENFAQTKQCALIAVNEVLKSLDSELLDLFSSGRNCPINHKHKEYWQQVKHEIEIL